jgi:outer membrane protein
MTPTARSSRRFGAVLVLCAAVAACARPALAQDTLSAPAHSGASPLQRPLSLGDAARLAARQSAAAMAARYQAAQAGARVTQSRAALLPELSVAGIGNGRSFNTATFGVPFPGFDPNGTVISGVNTIDLRTRASMNLLDLGALGRVRSAQSAALAEDATADNAAEQAAAAAAAAYLRAQRADAQLAARQADSVLADSLLGIAREQLRAGVGVALDVTRAEAQVAAVRAQLIAARNERDRARLELLRALGLPLDTPIELADSLAELPVTDTIPDESMAIARALRNRPDLRAADAQLEAARQAVRSIQAERLPTLSAFGDEGWIGINMGHLLNTYTWGIQVTLPIFDGLRREGRIEEQNALAREISVRRRDLAQQAAIEVRGALLDLAAAREQVDAARERVRLTEQEVAQAQDRFRTGVAGNADVITASLELNSARTQLVDALTAYHSARVALARAEGAVTALP